MNKKELIALISERLTGGDTTSASRGKYHPVVIEKTIEVAYNDIIRLTVDQAIKENKLFNTDHLVKSYYYKPVIDIKRNQWYIESGFSLDSKLIRQISQPRNRQANFALISNVSEFMWDELDVTKVDFTIGAMVETKRIYFDDLFHPQFFGEEIGEIMVKMVPNFDGLSNEDDVNVPLEVIMESVNRFWDRQKKDDQIDDNNIEQGR
jgi:hypothetical protein